jgi:TolB-like protein
MPIISANTHSRTEGYFRLEWKLAVDRSHLIAPGQAFLVPVVIDATQHTDERIPERFRELQWTRLPGAEATPAFVDRIRALMEGKSDLPQRESSSPGPAVPGGLAGGAAPGARRERRIRVAAVTLGILALAGAGLFVARNHLPWTKPASTALAPVTERSIAVLPFIDMSERKDQEYFADGMAEEIIDQLAKVPQLRVISRTSSFQFKGKGADVRAIGAAIGARYVVEGSVRRSGSQLRITAQLTDAADGSQRWSERYDRDIGDVLRVQDEIATSLVRALEVSVGAFETPARAALRVPAAYDAYLRARHAQDHFDREGFEEAADYYREALHLDPQFAQAAGAFALLQVNMANWGYLPVKSAMTDARESAILAARLDPSLAEPHNVLALIAIMYDWDWAAADREIAKARTLEQHDASTEWITAQLAETRGNWDEARRRIDAAIAMDPFVATEHYIRGEIQLAAGRFEEAEAAAHRALQISPSYNWAHYLLGKILVARGRLADALAVIEQEPDVEGRLYVDAVAHFAIGQRAASDDALSRLTAVAADDWAFGIAAVHAYRGEKDQAFQWLERAYAQRDVDLFLLKANREFAPITADPRYGAFLRRMNLPE